MDNYKIILLSNNLIFNISEKHILIYENIDNQQLKDNT